MLRWLRDLVQPRRSRPARRGPPATGRAVLAVAPGPPAPAGVAAVPEPSGELPPFAPFARALGVQIPPEPSPLSDEDEAEDERLAALLRERFAASRPEPASFPAIALQILTVLCVRHHDDAVPAGAEFVDLHLVRLTSALAEVREPLFAGRAAREVVQSAGALALDAYAVRALAAGVRQAEERAVLSFGARAR